MKPFYLVETTTKDNLIHQGIFYKPTKPEHGAILWVHGLTDNFYGDMGVLTTMVETLGKDGWGIASFNTRGHDVVTSIKKLDKKSPKSHANITIGAGYENFTECIYDIDAGISFLVDQGFKEIVIAGASTGANKVCYYAGTKKDPRVVGVILASPISDLPIESDNKNYKARLRRMQQLVKQGKGEVLLDDVSYLALTPKRYLSLFEPGSAEDVFDYYANPPKLRVFSRIKQPLCTILAGSDEYTDRPATDILGVFEKYQRSTHFRGIIIPNAFHSFGGNEKETVKAITDWLKFIGK